MEKNYAKYLHVPDDEDFPAISVNGISSSPTAQSGEVPCSISKSGLTWSEINGDPMYGEEGCIIEEDPSRCIHIIS